MNIVITGTNYGIGNAIAKEFLNNGHQVYGIDKALATISHQNYHHYRSDIYFDTLPELLPCDILINNAGVQNSGNDIDINLKGTIRVTEKYGIHNQIKSILFIASASAQTGAEFTEYAASKGGMVAYMKNVALKVASFGATANSLSPGGVITDLNKHIIDDKNLWEAVLKETMLNAWVSVEEIAKWSYFITVVNKSMTAQDLLIDNGEANKSNFIW